VIVDEIQDFSNVELRFIRALVEEKANDLFLVGDPFQSIYERRINFSQCGVNVKGKRSFQMKVNYRTTEEIRKFAIQTVKELNYEDFDGSEEKLNGYLSLFHGSEPQYQVFDTKEEEIAFIIEQITELVRVNELSYKDMVIATRTKDGY
ncbi:UvrD-helicase domain-containing protein, partial [Arthrospira platensis SPKY1]|nr:UvrD-helicase domain-containing protein [Arthrospira platensis SPKY1]